MGNFCCHFEARDKDQAGDQADLSKAIIIFVLGGPGSGKGTQCELIVKKYGYKHLSAGDLLREEVKKRTPLGKEMEGLMKEGKLVPTEVTVRLLRQAMQSSSNHKFLIDGFPRALDQAETFEQEVKPPELVLFFDCPEEEMKKRLLKRGESSGRSDDNEETIVKRFRTFLDCSMPVVEYYERKRKLAKISAVPPPDEVFVEVEKAMDSLPSQQSKASARNDDYETTDAHGAGQLAAA
ncbi:g13093 [Coccomyxa viridis]|uniref:UMP-CMP kinase n=1 Tax=Coccomyxa viridis TaxID=1274662 RepID=A0ABP1GCZ7_9CHLO